MWFLYAYIIGVCLSFKPILKHIYTVKKGSTLYLDQEDKFTIGFCTAISVILWPLAIGGYFVYEYHLKDIFEEKK